MPNTVLRGEGWEVLIGTAILGDRFIVFRVDGSLVAQGFNEDDDVNRERFVKRLRALARAATEAADALDKGERDV